MASMSSLVSQQRRCYPAVALLLLCSTLVPKAVEAQVFVRLCAIPEYSPVKAVVRNGNDSKTEYSFVDLDDANARMSDNDNDDTEGGGVRGRQLSSASASSEDPIPSFFIPSDSHHHHHNPRRLVSYPDNNNSNSSNIHVVRECPCALDHYCPIDLDTCGIPASYMEPIGCFESSAKKTLLRNAWPLLMLWYSTVLFFVLCTEKGRNARHYVLLKCCHSRLNERLVDRFLLMHGFISIRPNNPDAEGGGDTHSQQPLDWLPVARPVEPQREPTELVLKTAIFEANDDNEEEDVPTCTICFAALETGDRVGKLSCDHTFHVECLREWLPRRNVCPLCQTTDAATPRYAESDEDDNGDNNNENGSATENTVPVLEGQVELAPRDPLEIAQVDEEANANRVQQPPQQQRRVRNQSFAQRLLAASRAV